MITIPSDRIVDAAYGECWSICLWGNPKMKVICGGCTRPFETRSYLNLDGSIAVNCPHCGKWNKTGMVRS